MKQLGVFALAIASCTSKAPVPSGPHYHYVVSRTLVPMTTPETTAYGLDVNGDGVADNRLGGIVADFVGVLSFDAQAQTDTATFDGGMTTLVDLQTPDFASADGAGVQLFQAANANPAACGSGEAVTCTGSGSNQTCTGCGDDLTGSASFDIVPNPYAPLVGTITDGVFEGGNNGAELTLQLALFSPTPITVHVVDAHVVATKPSATAIGDPTDASTGMIIGGGILAQEFDAEVIPSLVQLLTNAQALDCATPAGSGSGGPSCNPTGNYQCSILEMTMDDTCSITLSSVESSTLISELLAPDLMLPQGSAVSVGVKVYAVGAQFTVPGEGSDEGSD